MQRITEKNLQAVVNRINRMTNSPMEYMTTIDGVRTINIGHYHLDGAYGGWKLSQTVNNGGGVRDVLSCGYETKRALYNLLFAYIAGLDTK